MVHLWAVETWSWYSGPWSGWSGIWSRDCKISVHWWWWSSEVTPSNVGDCICWLRLPPGWLPWMWLNSISTRVSRKCWSQHPLKRSTSMKNAKEQLIEGTKAIKGLFILQTTQIMVNVPSKNQPLWRMPRNNLLKVQKLSRSSKYLLILQTVQIMAEGRRIGCRRHQYQAHWITVLFVALPAELVFWSLFQLLSH